MERKGYRHGWPTLWDRSSKVVHQKPSSLIPSTHTVYAFESFTTTLKKIGILVEEELSKEVPAKTGNNWKNKHQCRDKKVSSSKEVHAINCIAEYTHIGTTYTQSLEQLLAKGKTNFYEIKRETESLKQSKYFNLSKYYKYHWSWEHDTKDYLTLKNKLERMFKSRQHPLPKAA